jgi:hypothetical protein
MKQSLLTLVIACTAACGSGAALAHTDVGIYLGVPGPVYAPPPPVIYQPPPVIYQQPQVVYGPSYGYRYRDDDWDRHREHDNGRHRGWDNHDEHRHHDHDD